MVFLSLTIRYCRFFICLAMIVLINMTRIPNYGPSPLSQKVPYILTPYYIEGRSVVITLISSSMRLLVGVGFLFMSDSALDRVVALIGLPVFLDSKCPPFSIAFFQFQPMRLPSSRALNSTATLWVFSTLRLKLLLHSNKDCMSSIDTSDTQNR